MKISVIVPTHNRKHKLLKALISISNQTFPNWHTWIICDNCTDGTPEYLEECFSNNILDKEKFTVIIYEKSLGGAAARNIGLELANGNYIAFLDDDDEWEVNKLKKQYKFLEDNEKIGIVGCNYMSVIEGNITYVDLKNKSSVNDILYKNELGSFSFCMIRSKLVSNIRIRPDLKAFQDWFFWLKIMLEKKAHAYILKDYLVKYSENSSEERISTNDFNRLDAYDKWINFFWKYFNSNQKYYHQSKYFSRSLKLKRSKSISDFFKLVYLSLKTVKINGFWDCIRNILHPYLSGKLNIVKTFHRKLKDKNLV